MKKIELQFLQAELNRVSDWVRFSDRKGAFLSVYYSAIFGIVISQKSEIVSKILVFNGWSSILFIILIIAFIISFCFGILYLIKSIFPRLENNFTNKSLFYFGNIASTKFVDYSTDMEKLSENEARKQLIEQIYTNSTIANQKMKNIQKSIKSLFFLGIITIVILIIL